MLASLRPALRATRVPPIAAVREGAVLPPLALRALRPGRRALRSAASRSRSSATALFGSGDHDRSRLLLLGVGVLGLFFGVAMIAPRLVRPLASVLGWPATRIGGVAGALARANAMRNPQRTASTASALMIGLALVTPSPCSRRDPASLRGRRQAEFHADYAVTAENDFSPIPVAAGRRAAATPGVATVVANVRGGDARVFGKTIQVTGVDPGRSGSSTWSGRSAPTPRSASSAPHGAIVDKGYAKTHDLRSARRSALAPPGGTFLAWRSRRSSTRPRAARRSAR